MMTLKTILEGTVANSEEDLELLWAVINPTYDREEMREKYKNALGHDPLEFYDRHDLECIFAELKATKMPPEIWGKLDTNKDEIINATLSHKDNINFDYLTYLLTLEMSKYMDRPINLRNDAYWEMTDVIENEFGVIPMVETDEDETDDEEDEEGDDEIYDDESDSENDIDE